LRITETSTSEQNSRQMACHRLAFLVGVLIWLVACGGASARVETSPAANASSPSPVHCVSVDGLPDSSCTPGVADTIDVSQDTVATTICQTGFTSRGIRADGRFVRPPTSYTDALKIEGIAMYGYADTNPADYEEDHLIPLELGGDGYSPGNLWPEPRSASHPAAAKDIVENRLHDLVCAGAVTLAAAQSAIASDWETAVTTVLPSSSPTAGPSPAVGLYVTITTSVYGFVAAQTLVGASCTAKARLPSGNYSKAQGLTVTATADQAGDVSWTYGTSATTSKGTGTHFVTCALGGKTVSTSAPFTVG
jgi:hypothetical protein